MDCIFCNLLKNDEDETLIYRFTNGSVYLNKNQFFYGRVLYVLDNHFIDITEVPADIFVETSQNLQILAKVIKSVTGADLINVASLGNYV